MRCHLVQLNHVNDIPKALTAPNCHRKPSCWGRAGYSVCLLCDLCRRDCWAGSKQSGSILRRAGPLVKPAGRIHSCWRIEGIRRACTTQGPWSQHPNVMFKPPSTSPLWRAFPNNCHVERSEFYNFQQTYVHHPHTAVFGRCLQVSKQTVVTGPTLLCLPCLPLPWMHSKPSCDKIRNQHTVQIDIAFNSPRCK